mgnify:CR=1 FL=1
MVVDTGGIESYTDDVILSQMRRQAEIAIERADVIVLVTDIRCGVTASDHDVANMLLKSGKPVVLAVNKCDTIGEPPAELYEFYNLGLGDPFPISSQHGNEPAICLMRFLGFFQRIKRKIMTMNM